MDETIVSAFAAALGGRDAVARAVPMANSAAAGWTVSVGP